MHVKYFLTKSALFYKSAISFFSKETSHEFFSALAFEMTIVDCILNVYATMHHK